MYTESDKKTAYRLYKKGWGYLKISHVIGCAASTVRKWIVKKGLETHDSPGYPEPFKKKVTEEYVERKDLSLDKVAKKNDVSPATLRRWLAAASIPTRAQRPPTTDRESILADLAAGMKKADVAARNHCSESWVYRVQNGTG